MKADEYRKILDSLPEEELPKDFHERLKSRLKHEVKMKQKAQYKNWHKVAAGLAAVLLLFVAIRLVDGNMLFMKNTSDSTPQDPGRLTGDDTQGNVNNDEVTNEGQFGQIPEETAMSIHADEVQLYVEDVTTATDSIYDMASKHNIQIDRIRNGSDNIIKLRLTEEDKRTLIYTELELIGRIEQMGSKSNDLISIYIIEE